MMGHPHYCPDLGPNNILRVQRSPTSEEVTVAPVLPHSETENSLELVQTSATV